MFRVFGVTERVGVLTEDPPEERGLDILDLSVLAYASSFFDEADVRPESYPLHQSKV